MSDVPLLISLIIFISMILVFTAIFYHFRYQQEHIRLLARAGRQKNKKSAFRESVLKILGGIGQFLKPGRTDEISRVKQSFFKAGYRHPNAPFIYFGVKSLLAVLLVCLFFLLKLFVLQTIPPEQTLFLGVFLALAGFFLPGAWLHIKIARRQDNIHEGFPNALDLLVVCVKAGMSLDAAISRVGKEIALSNKPAGEEFHLLNLDLQTGKPRHDALKSFAWRIDLDEINVFTSLLIQTDKFGTSVAQALLTHSDTMRTMRRQKIEEASAKVAVKILFPLVFFILPSLFIVLLGPAVINFIRGGG